QVSMVGVLLVVFVGKMLVGGRDHAADAYILFKGIGDRLEDNSSRMNDVEWNTHLKDSREQVETALEPLREAATSDEPGTQSLVWAGEQLLKMLQGTRLIPREMKAKFDNYMADFAEAPMSDALSPPPTEESQEVDDDSLPVVDDPAFSG
ncbi:MAG: hypothetical protein AB8G99_19905, partial [Planctomycetaceae bacterium]